MYTVADGFSDEEYSKLYSKFHKIIFKYIHFSISDRAVAEEITQEVFLKVHRFRDNYQAQYAFSTWLWTIARNTVADHLRLAKNALPASHSEFERASPVEDLPCPRFNAELRIIKKDQRLKFFRMIKTLPRQQKRVIWLRSIHQLSNVEISERLGISLAAVKNIVYRAKQSIVEKLDVPPSLLLS